MSKGSQDKKDEAFLDALSKEKEPTGKYTKGDVSREEHYQPVTKVWSSVLSNVLSVFIVTAAGIVSIVVFALIMFSPYFD